MQALAHCIYCDLPNGAIAYLYQGLANLSLFIGVYLSMSQNRTLLDFCSLDDLGDVLCVPGSIIQHLLDLDDEKKYKVFKIPKRKSGYRVIVSPIKELNTIQRALADCLTQIWEPTSCSFGFLPSRNIVDNAKGHLENKFILNIDIENFFPSISIDQVERALLDEPFEMDSYAAKIIGRICGYKGRLPQGAPSSPILSNIVLKELDQEMMEESKKHHIYYSRYADDLSFSSENPIPTCAFYYQKNDKSVKGFINDVVRRHGFKINKDKISVAGPSFHQEITGIVVNEKLNVHRRYISQLRSILHNCQVSGVYEQAIRYANSNQAKLPKNLKNNFGDVVYVEHWFSQVLKGKIEFVRMVKGHESPTFYMLASRYNQVFGTEFDIPSKSS